MPRQPPPRYPISGCLASGEVVTKPCA
jgi:hypothetical protein